jgi:hypothetical protein
MTIQLYNEGKYGVGKYGSLNTTLTYLECLTKIKEAQSVSSKLSLIKLLPIIRGDDNPVYREGIEVLNAQTNALVVQLLREEIYTFVRELLPEEYEAFNYLNSGYIVNNPGIQGNTYKSYVGVYINDNGERTDEPDL